jgi:hypothetical protein
LKTSTRFLTPFLSLAFLAVLSCSKTQDKAPERRIFGNPPTIQSVDPVFYEPDFPAQCNFTDIVTALFCQFGVLDLEVQAGRGWTVVTDPDGSNRRIVFSDVPSAAAGVFIEGTYSRLTFKVKATDPESTPQQSNILLVSSSYVQTEGGSGSQNENTLVLFDDGSENEFGFAQNANIGEDCTIDIPNATCTCGGAIYKVKSGDLDKGDDQFTRKFAIINPTASGFFLDCILRSQNVVGVSGPEGSKFDFKIEAVDKQGNLAAWPDTLTAVAGKGTFVCNGDSCGCCLLHAFSQLADITECIGQPGMLSPSYKDHGVPIGFPTGFCDECITRPLTNQCI